MSKISSDIISPRVGRASQEFREIDLGERE
jgi:hypothetical protein